MNLSQVILSVTRRRWDGTERITQLVQAGGRLELVYPSEAVRVLQAAAPIDAVRRSRRLRVARADEETLFRRHMPGSLPLEDFLDAVTVEESSPALTADDWEDEGLELFESFEGWEEEPFRVAVDGERVHLVPLDGGGWAVSPFDEVANGDLLEQFQPVLAARWDSSTYAGVGNAGWGQSGLYRLRIGLYAEGSSVDGAVDENGVQYFRSRQHPRTLALRCAPRYGLDDSVIRLYAPAAGKRLELRDPNQDDSLDSCLPEADLRWIARQLVRARTV